MQKRYQESTAGRYNERPDRHESAIAPFKGKWEKKVSDPSMPFLEGDLKRGVLIGIVQPPSMRGYDFSTISRLSGTKKELPLMSQFHGFVQNPEESFADFFLIRIT